MKVKNKVAVITGGGGGIGSALAATLARQGAKVVVSDLQTAATEPVVEAINDIHPGAALAVVADATDRADITRLVKEAENAFGPVDMFFANAGVAGQPGLHAPEESWDKAFEVDVRAHVRAAQVMVPGGWNAAKGILLARLLLQGC